VGSRNLPSMVMAATLKPGAALVWGAAAEWSVISAAVRLESAMMQQMNSKQQTVNQARVGRDIWKRRASAGCIGMGWPWTRGPVADSREPGKGNATAGAVHGWLADNIILLYVPAIYIVAKSSRQPN